MQQRQQRRAALASECAPRRRGAVSLVSPGRCAEKSSDSSIRLPDAGYRGHGGIGGALGRQKGRKGNPIGSRRVSLTPGAAVNLKQEMVLSCATPRDNLGFHGPFSPRRTHATPPAESRRIGAAGECQSQHGDRIDARPGDPALIFDHDPKATVGPVLAPQEPLMT